MPSKDDLVGGCLFLGACALALFALLIYLSLTTPRAPKDEFAEKMRVKRERQTKFIEELYEAAKKHDEGRD